MSQQLEYFGKYILLEKLATGGMAEVYLAKAPGAEGVHKYFALKRILPQYSQNEEFIDMFKEEAKIVINLNHSNIVSIYEFGEINSLFYLAMEFVQGKNLRQILNHLKKTSDKFTIEKSIYIINEVAKGLDQAHRAHNGTTGQPLNIIHRDISPQNVMISFDGDVKLVDFGIAKAESKVESTRAGTLKGKFGYMSPEQAEGADLDARTDIFSLGIVLWEMLAGERLFTANNEINTLRKIRDCQIPALTKINPQVPMELERIVSKALTRNRNLRYQTAGDLSKDLSRFLNTTFPDFSSQDFGQFIKQLFLHEIQTQRTKLIEYSKVPFAEKEDRTVATSDVTQTLTDRRPTKQGPDLLKNISKGTEEKLAASVDFKQGSINPVELHKRLQNQTQTKSRATSTGVSYPHSTSISYIPTRKTEAQNHPMRWALSALVIAFVSLCSWFFYQKPQAWQKLTHFNSKEISQELMQSSHSTNAGSNINTAQTNSAPMPVETFTLFVTSSPAGADIFLDNQFLAQTPNSIRVPARKKYHLALKKDNFLNYDTDLETAGNAQKFEATLQPAGARLSIEAYPSFEYLQVFINDNKLSEKLPLSNYAVQQGIPLRIRVYNPYTQAEASSVVTIPAGRSHKLTLLLKVNTNQRDPSQQK